jgi:hypothetical protein
MIKLVTLDNSVKATLLKHKLEQEGIVCFLANEHIGTLFNHLYGVMDTGIQVIVKQEDFTRASEILRLDEQAGRITECPYCGSKDIGFGIGGKKRNRNILFIVFMLLFAGPTSMKNRYYCKHCKEDFGS